MFPPTVLEANDPEKMAQIGHSLTKSLYHKACDIVLKGELGSGKTTFVQGVARGLRIADRILSPTFALENRYDSEKKPALIHLDLYRLTPAQAEAQLSATEEEEVIRCIEWSPSFTSSRPRIVVRIDDTSPPLRTVAITFEDARVPTRRQIDAWRADMRLQPHIIAHCETVAVLCGRLADALIARGSVVRKELLVAAAQLHDLLRFIDFRPGGAAEIAAPSDEEQRIWDAVKQTYAPLHHEDACAALLRTHGLPEAAEIVRTHGLHGPADGGSTIEQQLLFYADKRVMGATVVSVSERFADFERRYGNAQRTEALAWQESCTRMERLLFPDGTAFLTDARR